MPLDIFSPVFQLAAIRQMTPISMFLQTAFVQEGRAVPQEIAIWDVKKGKRRMAPFVGKNVGGVVTSRTGYHTEKIEFPKIAPERPVTMDDLLSRAFGEGFVSSMTPEQRALQLMAEDLQELREEIACRREWMAAQILFTGKMDLPVYVDGGMVEDNPDYVDFGFANQFTPDTPWDEDGSDIVADMEAMNKIVLAGQGAVDIIIMAADVKAAMYNNEAYMAKLDNRRFNAGLFTPEFQGQSLLFLGVNHLGTPMYEYFGTVVDHTGTEVKLVPDGKILLGSRKMLHSLYGPITQVEDDRNFRTYLEKEVPLRYGSTKGNSLLQRVTSRPVIMPFNVDGWAIGNVL